MFSQMLYMNTKTYTESELVEWFDDMKHANGQKFYRFIEKSIISTSNELDDYNTIKIIEINSCYA